MAFFKVSTYEDAVKQLKVFKKSVPTLPIFIVGKGTNLKIDCETQNEIDCSARIIEIDSPQEAQSPSYILDIRNFHHDRS